MLHTDLPKQKEIASMISFLIQDVEELVSENELLKSKVKQLQEYHDKTEEVHHNLSLTPFLVFFIYIFFFVFVSVDCFVMKLLIIIKIYFREAISKSYLQEHSCRLNNKIVDKQASDVETTSVK